MANDPDDVPEAEWAARDARFRAELEADPAKAAKWQEIQAMLAEYLAPLRAIADSVASARLKQILEPGTPSGDALLLLRSGASDDERAEAVQRIAARVEYPAKNGRALVVIDICARAEGLTPRKMWRRRVAATIPLALQNATCPRRLRLGVRWVKDEMGRPLLISGEDATGLPDFHLWLEREASRLALESLSAETRSNARRAVTFPAAEIAGGPEDLGLLDDTDLATRLGSMLSDAELGMLSLFSSGVPRAEWCYRLGKKPGAVRAAWHRLREKLKANRSA